MNAVASSEFSPQPPGADGGVPSFSLHVVEAGVLLKYASNVVCAHPHSG